MINSIIEIYGQMILGAGVIPQQIIFSFASVLLLSKKKKWWVNLLEFLSLYLFLVLFLLIMYTLVEIPYTSIITYHGFPYIVGIVLFTLYTILLDKSNLNHQITVAALLYTLFYTITTFSGAVGTCQEYEWFLDTDFDFTFWISLILFVLASVFLFIFNIRKFDFFPSFCKYFSLVYMFFVIAIFSAFRAYVYPLYTGTRNLYLFFYGIILLFSFFIYFFFYRIAQEYQEKTNAMLFYEEHKNDEVLSQITQQNYDNMRRIRHDLKNQYGMMKLLLDEKKYDELSEYFLQYSDHLTNIFQYSTCGNVVIENLLNLEKYKAKEFDIQIESNIFVPKKLPFSNVDLCSLITNLLDNAIEAVKELDSNDKKISIAISTHLSSFMIQVVNPCKKDIDPHFKTTKADKTSHGNGLKIIRNIVKKYNGTLDIQYDTQFSVSILLQMLNEKGEAYEQQYLENPTL